jgi:hypothetical protein
MARIYDVHYKPINKDYYILSVVLIVIVYIFVYILRKRNLYAEILAKELAEQESKKKV